jgi:hypothetical protein
MNKKKKHFTFHHYWGAFCQGGFLSGGLLSCSQICPKKKEADFVQGTATV